MDVMEVTLYCDQKIINALLRLFNMFVNLTFSINTSNSATEMCINSFNI